MLTVSAVARNLKEDVDSVTLDEIIDHATSLSPPLVNATLPVQSSKRARSDTGHVHDEMPAAKRPNSTRTGSAISDMVDDNDGMEIESDDAFAKDMRQAAEAKYDGDHFELALMLEKDKKIREDEEKKQKEIEVKQKEFEAKIRKDIEEKVRKEYEDEIRKEYEEKKKKELEEEEKKKKEYEAKVRKEMEKKIQKEAEEKIKKELEKKTIKYGLSDRTRSVLDHFVNKGKDGK